VKTRRATGECALVSACTVYLVTVGFSFLMAAAVLSGQPSNLLARADDRVRGDPQAPVTLIEYSDFTCGFCLKFFRETWPRLRADYIETGKVRFLYRDFPRGFQGPGLDAAVAARCAGDQGRYWQMHDRLFGDDRRLGPADLQRHAQIVGLDLPLFSKCLEEAPHTDAIRRDREEGVRLGFVGTPGFVLLRTQGTGQQRPIAIPGAVPFKVFQEQIDRLLGAPSPKGKG
jgi:protein-disulfide isomerase